ncbi:hypothetical protein GCM10011392_07740 [Wenxinia marina]|nr:hypothetical protein GCM10011392_07740 [Wenxinia marina]
MNPEGPGWEQDGISGGQTTLVSFGAASWDIFFTDTIGSFSYSGDGATVVELGRYGNRLTIGAFRGTYTDVFTFDFASSELVWTSHKIGTMVSKVAVYRADCEMFAPL